MSTNKTETLGTTAAEMLKISNAVKLEREVDSLLKEVMGACHREASFGRSFAAIAIYALNANPAAYDGLVDKLDDLGYTLGERPYVFLDGQIRQALHIRWGDV